MVDTTGMGTIHIENCGLNAMIQAMRDIQTKGIAQAQDELDRALDRAAETSRGLAHVHTGALKASQTTSTDHGPSNWSGSVSYSARGAHFELALGGDHAAFIDALSPATDPDFEQALDRTFD